MTMTDLSTIVLSKTVVSPGGTLGWMNPELLDPPRFSSDGCPTRESDCYALGMVVYEVGPLRLQQRQSIAHPFQVLTGLRPFHHVAACTPVFAIMRGDRPRKPLDAESLGFSEELWELVRLCWSETSSTRPTAQCLLDYLSPAYPSWAPPLVYPAKVPDDPSADIDLYTPPRLLLDISQGVEATDSMGSSLVFILVLLLIMAI